MGSENILAIGSTVVVQIRSEFFARRMVTISTVILAIFFKQRSDFLDGICLFFQLLGQKCIGFSECCLYTTILSSGRGQVFEFSKGFSEILFRHAFACVGSRTRKIEY